MKLTLSGFLNVLIVLLVLGFIAKKIYLMPKQKTGEMAPDFRAELMSGDQFFLSDLKGHYVLIEFWASWCGPCRKENKELVDLYDTFKDSSFNGASSFEIVSIGLEKNIEKYRQAIRQDRLRWPYHIFQENDFESKIAGLYSVKEIPRKYLINPEGLIVMINPTVREIHDYLSNKTKISGNY